MSDDRATPHRADTRERLEDRLHRPRSPLAPVIAERDPVRLVADALQELERRTGAVERDRRRKAGDEHLLLPLRKRDDGHAREIALLHGGERRPELPLASVDDDE